MAPQKLSSISVNGIRSDVVLYEGRRIRVYNDAATALRIIELFADQDVDEQLKYALLLDLLFPDPAAVLDAIEDHEALVIDFVSYICGLDVSKDRDSSQKDIIDFEQDDAYIRASVYAAYGKQHDELIREVSFVEYKQLLGLVPHETPLGQALYYRTAKPPKRTKHNAEECKDFDKRKKFWALKKKPGDDISNAANSASDAFAALAKVAQNG